MLRFAAVLLFIVPIPLTAEAQGTAPPKLQRVFSDDFSKDTRSDYKIDGNVTWEKGKLTLAEGASTGRAINGGAWAKVELALELPKLTQAQPESELRIWFILDGATNCYVRLRRTLTDSGPAGSVAVVDTGEKDGKTIEQVVRQTVLQNRDLERLSVEYRYGLVRVAADNEALLMAEVRNGIATVSATMLQVTSIVSLTLLAAAKVDQDSKGPNGAKQLSDDQKRQLEEAQTIYSEFIKLYGAGKFAGAAEVGEKLLDIYKSAVGERHATYATHLGNMGAVYYRMGEYARAEPLYKQSLEIEVSVHGANHPSCANSLNSLAALYMGIGDYGQAEHFYKQALKIQKLALSEQHPSYATSLSNLAILYEMMGDYIRAEPLHKQAIQIQEAVLGKEHTEYARCLVGLASLYEALGIYERAASFYIQAKTIVAKNLGEDHPHYAAILVNLGQHYSRMGDYVRAVAVINQAVEIQASALGEKHPDFATSLSSLSTLHYSMGDYARAEQLYRKVLEIQKSAIGEKHPEYATSLTNLGMVYSKTGRYADAETLMMQVLEIRKSVFGEKRPSYAGSLNHLATLYQDMGEYARAKPLYKQSTEILRSVLGEKHPSYAISLNNLALLYTQMGDYELAESHYKQALEIQNLVFGKMHRECATTLNNLAELYSNMDDYDRAEALVRQAVVIVQEKLDHDSVLQSERQQKRNQSNERIHLDSRIGIALRSGAAPQEVLDTVWQWKGAVTFRQRAYRQVASDPTLAPIFDSLQIVSGQLSVVSGQVPSPPRSTDHDAAFENYKQERKLWQERFASLTRKREVLEQRISAENAEFRLIRQPLTVAAVQSWLPDGTALIDVLEYSHGTPNAEQKGKTDYEQRYIAFVLRRDQPPAMIGLGSAGSMSKAITAFRRPFLAGENTARNREAGEKAAQRVRNDLWLPIEEYLDGIDTVIISPDTALGTLPFAALPGRKDGGYLLQDYRIAMLPMANLLPAMFEDESADSVLPGLLLVGDVDYDSRPGVSESLDDQPLLMADARGLRGGRQHQWDSLSGFQEELKSVQSLHLRRFGETARTESLTRSSASENMFLKQAPQYGTLHVITHGYFEDPSVKSITQAEANNNTFSADRRGPDPFINTHLPGLLSGLVMAGANKPSIDPDDPRDGILRASEIEASSMSGVDLVVLSACETGLGAVAGGEGLTGLQRAFQIAGARSVIASLWKVDDDATLALMTEFYTNLWDKKMSKLDALREAQLTMLKSYDPKAGQLRGLGFKSVKVDTTKPATDQNSNGRLDPRYWAAFQLSGDWR